MFHRVWSLFARCGLTWWKKYFEACLNKSCLFCLGIVLEWRHANLGFSLPLPLPLSNTHLCVVYFYQQIDALHLICWSKSYFSIFSLFCLIFKGNKAGLQHVSRPVELVHYIKGWGLVPGNISGAHRQTNIQTDKQTDRQTKVILLSNCSMFWVFCVE